MRKLGLACLVALTSCGSEEPERGVDTTLPTLPASISGAISGPNEYLPSDLQVCAETADKGQTLCDAKVSPSVYTGSYEMELPPGSYRIFARTSELPGYKAYYTGCNTELTCTAHSPIMVTLKEGDSRPDVDPQDWWNRPKPPPVTVDDGEADASNYIVGEDDAPVSQATDDNQINTLANEAVDE